MSVDLSIHNCKKITARAFGGNSSHWVELGFTIGAGIETLGVCIFFSDNPALAEAYAAAINGVTAKQTAAIHARETAT